MSRYSSGIEMGERQPLMINDDDIHLQIPPQTTKEKIHAMYSDIVEGGVFSPLNNDVEGRFFWKRNFLGINISYWQAATSFLAFCAYAFLAYRTGTYFKALGKDAADELPDSGYNREGNELLTPYASSWINITLNFTVMFGAQMTMLFWYNMSKLLNKHGFDPFWKIALSIFLVGAVWAVSSAIPFAGLVLREHPGISEPFFEQWITFSIMHGVGAYAVVNIVLTLLVSIYVAYKAWKNPIQQDYESIDKSEKSDKEAEQYNKKFAEDITLVADNPNYYLDVREKGDSLNPQDYFRDKTNIPSQDEFSALSVTEKFAWQIKCSAAWVDGTTLQLRSFPWLAAAIKWAAILAVTSVIWASLPGYYNLTIFGGMKAFYKMFFRIDAPSPAESYIGGSIAFGAFGSLLLWVIYRTTEKLQKLATSGLTWLINHSGCISPNKNFSSLGMPKSREKHPWLLLGLAMFFMAVVGMGYYMGYLSSAAPHALNVKWAHLDELWLYILNAIGSSFFNGYGIFSTSLDLYANANLLINFDSEDRKAIWNLGYADKFAGSSQKSSTNMHGLSFESDQPKQSWGDWASMWKDWAGEKVSACRSVTCYPTA